jgi:leader peptidase (prepilin peptidase) / N-methyltransferase
LMGPVGVTPATTLRYAVFGAGIGFAAFALVALVGEKVMKKEALGFGDVWLLAGFGAWFGPAALLPIVLLASVQGSIVGIALIAMGKGQPGPDLPTSSSTSTSAATQSPDAANEDWIPPKNAVPFGPFLVAGALEWLWLGDLLARWVPLLRVFR